MLYLKFPANCPITFSAVFADLSHQNRSPKIGLAGLIMAEKFPKLVSSDHFGCQNQSGWTNFGSQNWFHSANFGPL